MAIINSLGGAKQIVLFFYSHDIQGEKASKVGDRFSLPNLQLMSLGFVLMAML
jgi:hypothetical protein